MVAKEKVQKTQRLKLAHFKCKKCGHCFFIKIISITRIGGFIGETCTSHGLKCAKCRTDVGGIIEKQIFYDREVAENLFENESFVRSYMDWYGEGRDTYSKGVIDFLYRASEMPLVQARKLYKYWVNGNADKAWMMWPCTEAAEKFPNVSFGTIFCIIYWIINKRDKYIASKEERQNIILHTQ